LPKSIGGERRTDPWRNGWRLRTGYAGEDRRRGSRLVRVITQLIAILAIAATQPAREDGGDVIFIFSFQPGQVGFNAVSLDFEPSQSPPRSFDRMFTPHQVGRADRHCWNERG
jgi:hypothetical protein